jgi:hypothetical protein
MLVFVLTGLLVFGWVVFVVEGVSGRIQAFGDLFRSFEVEVSSAKGRRFPLRL